MQKKIKIKVGDKIRIISSKESYCKRHNLVGKNAIITEDMGPEFRINIKDGNGVSHILLNNEFILIDDDKGLKCRK